ncbi:MAG: helix-turn-helix transcriptional regulator [Candidatus Zixiibacteriota bacterium]
MLYYDIVMDNLIERLESYRLEHRISQQKLAALLGVAFVTVSRWLNGHTKPNKIQAYHIEKLLAQKRKKK